MGAQNEFLRKQVIEACKATEAEILAIRSQKMEKLIKLFTDGYREFSWKKLRYVMVYPTREEALYILANMNCWDQMGLWIEYDAAKSYGSSWLTTVRNIKQAAEDGIQYTRFSLTASEYDLIAKHYSER